MVPVFCQTRLQEHVPARPENVALLRHAIDDLAAAGGASDHQREDIALAVSEALSNAVLHAYVGRDSPGSMAVQAWAQEDRFHVVVCDAGIGMSRRSDSPGLGLGLELIGRMTEQLQVDALEMMSGVRLRMSFDIG